MFLLSVHTMLSRNTDFIILSLEMQHKVGFETRYPEFKLLHVGIFSLFKNERLLITYIQIQKCYPYCEPHANIFLTIFDLGIFS